MKKFYALLIILALVPTFCAAQAKIYTKKVKLSDFTTKTTKVVLTGGDLTDSAIKDEIARRWRISPYEFCTLEEYESLKKDQNYYFLRMVDIKGVTMFSLDREGFEVLNLPLCNADEPSGREMIFLPAFIDILQTYVMDSINSDMTGYVGLKNYNRNIFHTGDKTIYIAREDLATDVNPDWKAKGIEITDADEVEDLFLEEDEDAIVSYTVAPSEGGSGAKYFVFLINAENHSICYFASHPFSESKPAGFTKADMKGISSLKR